MTEQNERGEIESLPHQKHKPKADDNINDPDNTSKEEDYSRGSHCHRSPHDKENPYSMTLNALTRDASISPNCRWLLTYLLSNVDNWEIRVQQVINHLSPHMGRDKVRSIFKEGIDAGYIERREILVSLKKGGKLKRLDYFISESPIFKKCYRRPENQGPGGPGPGDPPLRKTIEPSVPKNDHHQQPSSDDDVNLKNEVREAFDALPKEEQHQIMALYRKQKKVDNPEGWFTNCMKEKWHLKTFDLPSEEDPESVTNKKHNEPIAKVLMETLEGRSDLHILLTRDFIELGASGQRAYTVLLSESPCVFSAQIKKVLEICKVDVDFPSL